MKLKPSKVVLQKPNSIKNSIYLLRHRDVTSYLIGLLKILFFIFYCVVLLNCDFEFSFLFLALSAHKVNRRPGALHPTLRRQPGVKSTSNLRMHEAPSSSANSRMASEAPEMRLGGATSAGSHRTPSYMKSTAASSKKLKNFQTPVHSHNSNENQGPISGPQRMTGVYQKQNR